MGPGLFLALALLSAGARAESSVGLDAKGVDPMAAVDNRDGLDVRDALGRPVSAQKVLAELKKASAARAAETAYASTLPKARTILAALELATVPTAWLFQLAESLPPVKTWASMPLPGPKCPALLLVLLGAVLAPAAVLLRPDLKPLLLRAGRCCPEVLRC